MPPAWLPFLNVVATISASLTGLLFIGISVSLAKLLEHEYLPGIALQAVLLLALQLATALCGIAPVTTTSVRFASGIAGCTAAAAIIVAVIQTRSWRHVTPEFRRAVAGLAVLTDVTLVFQITIAIALLLTGWTALALLLPAMLLTLCVALINAWLVLVEVHR